LVAAELRTSELVAWLYLCALPLPLARPGERGVIVSGLP
jgi:hypothetical protein